jgi:hypothetical protein
MKTISWLLLMDKRFMNAILFFALIALGSACTDEVISNGPNSGAAGASPKSLNTVPYVITNTSDGLVYNIHLVAPTGAKDPGHVLLQFQDCDGNYLAGSYIQSATINGVDWPIAYTTGSGTNCSPSNTEPFIKLDNLNGRDLQIVVTLNSAAVSGSIIVKSGTSCSAPTTLTSTYSCATLEICYTESAWSDGTKYVTKGNWATYTSYSGTAKTVTLWAGKTYDAGTVSFSAVSGGMVTISISFADGWGLNPTDAQGDPILEGVKIQGYTTTPPANNPAPGLFTTYKGNNLTVSVPQFAFYGVHVDVAYSSINCPE